MSCALGHKALHPAARRRGLTLTELLVAVTIVTLILTGVVLAFIELLRSNDRAQARIDATANARSAIEHLTTEFKRAETTGPRTLIFQGFTESAGAFGGDLLDQDQDGTVDEEPLNGADNDNDWTLARDDKHAVFPETSYGTESVYAERPVYYRFVDMDDGWVDVDIQQTSSSVTFSTFDVASELMFRQVRFYLGNDPEGQPNTLMKEVSGTDPESLTTRTIVAPVAHNVFSFGLLFWDYTVAQDPNANPWRTSWDSTAGGTAAPATVYMTISVYAGTPLSLREIAAGQKVPTVTLTSLVNLESVLADPAFRASKPAQLAPVSTGAQVAGSPGSPNMVSSGR